MGLVGNAVFEQKKKKLERWMIRRSYIFTWVYVPSVFRNLALPP